MYLNLINLEYKDYEVDFNKIKIYLNHLSEIQKFSIENKIYFSLIGHLSLILLSRKIYRNPDDIDILILLKDLNKWLNFLKQDWTIFGNIESLNILQMFVGNELQKFASTNVKTCSISEKDADLYKISFNNFNLHSKSRSFNEINKENIAQPQFIYHDPQKKTHKNTDFVEFHRDKFKIWFYTNNLAQHFKSYLIFYNNDLSVKELIECSFQYDFVENNSIYAYWCSPEIDFDLFNGCFYRIFVHKELFAIRLQHPQTKILLECYICKNLCSFYDAPIKYIDKYGPIKNLSISFNRLPMEIQYPYRALNNKYGRPKDLDDYEVYRYLMDEYPLTNL